MTKETNLTSFGFKTLLLKDVMDEIFDSFSMDEVTKECVFLDHCQE